LGARPGGNHLALVNPEQMRDVAGQVLNPRRDEQHA